MARTKHLLPSLSDGVVQQSTFKFGDVNLVDMGVSLLVVNQSM